MKKKMTLLNIFYAIIFLWAVLTLIVEQAGPIKQFHYKSEGSTNKAMVVYSPDIFYNFDEQVCRSFAEGLVEEGWSVDVLSVKATQNFDANDYDLFVVCANTYNWSPDWSISRFVSTHPQLEEKNMVAITLGGGSTARAQRIFEEKIRARNNRLLKSESYWLMRPNDETRMDDPNVQVGVEKAKKLGRTVGTNFEEIGLVTSN